MATDSEHNKDLTLAELLDTSFVRCEYCSNVFTSSLLLPCLHTFCEKCIVEIAALENEEILRGVNNIGKYEKTKLTNLNGTSVTKTPSKSNTNHRVHGYNNNSTDQFLFHCPTCKSQITIDSSAGGLDNTTTTITDCQEDSINVDSSKINHKDSDNKKASHILSLDIAATNVYKLMKISIRRCLPRNHFMESVTQLYRYRNDTGRECAYCKTEDVIAEASCLCLQCGDDVCDACAGAHRKTRITRDHSVVSYTAIQQGLFDHDIRKAGGIVCEDHPESTVTDFCNDCLKVVCKDCRSKSHYSHNIHNITDAAAKLAPEIQNVQQGLFRRIPDLTQYVEFLSDQLKSLQQRHDRTTEEINNQVELLHKMVDQWKAKTISTLDATVIKERKNIEDKIHNFNISRNSMEKSSSFLLHLFNLGKPDEKMGLYISIMRRYQQLIRTKPKAMTTRLGISFTPGPVTDQNMQILIGKLGLKQEGFNNKDTPKNLLPISTLMPAILEPTILIKSWTISSSSSSSTPAASKNKNQQHHSSRYISGIDIKGNLLAAVDRENAKVLIVDTVSQKVLKEFTGTGSHKLCKPFDVAFLPSGVLAVTDPEVSAVRVFDWTGKFLFTFDGGVRSEGVFTRKERQRNKQDADNDSLDSDDGKQLSNIEHPRGITLNKRGEVVVLDAHLRHCTIHDSNTGKILRTIHPYREITSSVNNKDINEKLTKCTETDSLNDEALNMKPSSENDEQGSNSIRKSPSELDVILVDPFYISATLDGNLVITDAASPNVKILGPNGCVLQESLDYGTRQEECLHPAGVCVDHKSGYILLVDTNNNRIQLGLPDGTFSTTLISPPLTTTPTSTSPDLLLSQPTCVCLDQDGHLVVAQVGGKINVYKYL